MSESRSLVPCPTCEHEIAQDAVRCPQCGGITPKARRRRFWTALFVALLAATGTVAVIKHRSDAKAKRDVDNYVHCIEAGGTNATCQL